MKLKHSQQCFKKKYSGLRLVVHQLYPGLFKKLQCHWVWVFTLEHDLPDACVDQDLGAQDTGLVGNIIDRPLNGYAMHCGLDDGVLLRVEAPAKFVTLAGWHSFLFPQAAYIQAVPQARRRTIVTTGKNSFVFDNHRTHLPSEAG
jgi:hypothetical protein